MTTCDRFRVVVDVHADDIPTLIALLNEAGRADGEPIHAPYDRASGNPSGGYHVEVTEDPEMTPERYRAELDAYLAEKRSR